MDPNSYNLKDFPTKARRLRAKIYLHGEVTDLAHLIYKMVFEKVPTYRNRSMRNPITQCGKFHLRSVEDIFNAARTINKNVKPEEVLLALKKLYKKEQNIDKDPQGLIHASYCSTVLRQVHSPSNYSTTLEAVRKKLGNLNIKF